jgi:hypothetical protein
VLPGLESGVTAISAGSGHVCAIKGGELFCWGVNRHGQLGDGTRGDSADPVAVVWQAPGTPAAAAPTPGSPDVDKLLAAVEAAYPGIGFDPECSADLPHGPCINAAWTPEGLATGVARITVTEGIGGVIVLFGRTPADDWAYWARIGNGGGGPLYEFPGEATVCAGGSGLNLRAEPSTDAARVTLLADGSTVTADRFLLTEPGDPNDPAGPFVHGDGWYHIVSPQEGWAYDRFLLTVEQGPCGPQWWLQ